MTRTADQKRTYDREWRRRNPAKVAVYRAKFAPSPKSVRDSNYRRSYGLSYEEVEAKLASQDGMCDVCDMELEFPHRRTHVDHDHKTGKVRGILCADCNTLLGYAKDDEFNLRRAVAYLLHYRRHT